MITPEQLKAMQSTADQQALDWANRAVALQGTDVGLASYAESIGILLKVFANAAGRRP